MISEEQKAKDKELVERTRRGWKDFINPVVGITIDQLKGNPDYFREKLNGKALYDIGSPFFNPALLILEGLNLGIYKFVMVDPFHREYMYEELQKKKTINPKLRLELSSLDGLTFLNQQGDGSGNVMSNNMDYAIVGSDPYLRRLAEEAYRVVPIGGIYISCNSETERRAEELFPTMRDFGLVKVFEK